MNFSTLLTLFATFSICSSTAIRNPLTIRGQSESAICNLCIDFVDEAKEIINTDAPTVKQDLLDMCSRVFKRIDILEYQCEVIVVYDLAKFVNVVNARVSPQQTCHDFLHVCKSTN